MTATQTTTPEQALNASRLAGDPAMLRAFSIARTMGLGSYLIHPEIITGLAQGKFGPNGIMRRLREMESADAN